MTRRKITDARRGSKSRQRGAQQASLPQLDQIPIVDVDTEGRIHYLNAVAERLFPELRNRGVRHSWLADWPAVVSRFRHDADRKHVREVTVDGIRFSQSMYFVAETGRIRIYGLDVTEQRRIQRERDITIEFLHLVNESADAKELIRAATTFFQEQSGCQAMGVRLKDGRDFPYFEARGFPHEFVVAENSLGSSLETSAPPHNGDGGPSVDCMCAKVIHGRVDSSRPFFTPHGSFWTNSTSALASTATNGDRPPCTRNRCNREGYESVALLPLKVGDERLGLLQLNDRRSGVFSREVISLWERLADQLAVALAKFRAEEALIESRADLNRAQIVAQTGSWRLDLTRKEMRWSDEMYRIFGIAKGTPLTYPRLLAAVHPDDRGDLERAWQAAFRGAPYDVEHRIVADGGVRWIRGKAEVEFDPQGEAVGAFGTVQDISDSKQREQELQRLNRTLKALRDSSQAVSCASLEPEFLDAICRIIVEDCGHRMVWIGFAERDEKKSVRPAACAGFEAGYIENLNVTWADDERGRGPTGTAIRRGRPTACRNMLTDPHFAPWRDEAIKRGYASSIALPLIDGERAFGAITIYSTEADPFSADEVRMLSELANDLAYGIMAIRLRNAHQQAEELLLKSAERYRSLVELSPDPVFVNRNDRIEYVNAAGMRLLGVTSSAQILGRSPLTLIHPDYRALAQERVAMLQPGQSVPRMEEKIVRLDGEVRDVEVVASAFVDQQGPAIQVILHDITDRKIAEERMRLHLKILESTANAIVISDRDGVIQWVNPAFTHLTDYLPGEVVGKNPRVLKSGMQEAAFYKEIWRTILAGQVWHGELVNRRKDGSLYTEEMTITPVTDPAGGIRHFIAVKQDISQRKLMEDRLRTAKDAAEAANVAKDHFIANVSHELRTPMNAILGMTELALDEDLPPSVRNYLATAKESADMLLDLLNEILDFSRLEAAQFQLDARPFSLRRLLTNTLKTLGVSAYEKGLELICDMADHVPDQLLGDSLRLRQVLLNLLGNAIKFTARGEIVVRVANVETSCNDIARGSAASNGDLANDEVLLEFSVTDTGIGIASEEQAKIFAPFTQVDASMTRNFGGTGLGLAIAANLVELMGGRIGVESQVGRGSVFTFSVRLKRQTGFVLDAEQAVRQRLQGTPILLVAANRAVGQILQEMLTRWGMRPQTLRDVPAALAALSEADAAGRAIPAALIDASVADIDGWELANWIKNNPALADHAILLFSPCDRAAHLRRCQELGIQCLEKPIFHSQLLGRIAQVIGAAAPPPAAAASSPAAEHARAQPRRVLVVEDNRANQELALHILRKHGHFATVAENGIQALARLRHEDFDVVLMDIQMPKMDGYQATAAIRALDEPEKARVPIIAMTAHAMASHHRRCLAAGMDGYLDKPIKAERLIDIIENLGKETWCEPNAVEAADESPAPQASQPIFDLKEALARCFDRVMFEQMRDYFYTQSVEVLEQIGFALQDQNAAEVARAAHALRGTVVYLGARPCVQAAEVVEHSGQNGDLETAAKAFEGLANQIELLKNALRSTTAKKKE
jgi:two-component system, sensor histidine kinase and response regulator